MKKSLFIVLMSAFVVAPAFAEEAAPATPGAITEPAAAAPDAPTLTVSQGQMVVAAGGVRLGQVSRIAADGSPRVINQGRLITIPLSSLTLVDGRLVSSLTRAQINALN